MKRKPRVALLLLCATLFMTLLAACDGGNGDGGGGLGDILPGGGGDTPDVADPEFVRTPPPLVLAEFGNENVLTYDLDGTNIYLDMTNVGKGYVGVRATSPAHGQFEVANLTTGAMYRYILDTTGKDQFFPLSMGNGTYKFVVYINAQNPAAPDDYYFPLEGTAEVALENELAPFLVNSAVVDYGPESSAVKLSYELTEHAQTDLEVIQQVYYWIEENISYDTEKAEFVITNAYVPDLEQVLADKKGICYDYASLAAAMLRANAIPTQMIFGDVDTGQGSFVYHAWNLIWTQEDGWVAAEIAATPDGWVQIDLTFAASLGTGIAGFIGNGENYAGSSVH